MAVETLLIKPKLDDAAMREAERKIGKAFSALEKAIKEATQAASGFYGQFKKIEDTLGRSRRGAKEFARDFKQVEGASERMAADLRRAEQTLGKSHPITQKMRADYQRVSVEVARLRKDTEARMGHERQMAAYAKMEAASAKAIAAERKEIERTQKRMQRDEERHGAKMEALAKKRADLAEKERKNRTTFADAVLGRDRSRTDATRDFLRKRGALGVAGKVGGAIGQTSREAFGAARTGVGIGLGVGAAALGIGAAAVEGVRSQADMAAKSANLQVAEFGRLKHAAELSGTSIEVVDKTTQKLNATLSKKLTPEVAGALDFIGLKAKDLQGLRPEEQLGKIGDAMRGVKDPADRVVIASRLFGEEMGAKLIPLLEAGSTGIREMGNEAEALGIVFDDKTAKAAERLGDAQDKIRKGFQGVVNTIVAEYMPTLAALAERAVEWIKANREMIEGKVRDALSAVAEAAEKVWRWIGEVDWQGVWRQVSDFAATVFDLAQKIYGLVESLGAGNAALALMAVRVGSLLGPYGLLAAAGAAAGYAIVSAFAKANDQLENTISKIRSVQAEAGLKAVEGEAGQQAEQAEAAAGRSRKASDVSKRMEAAYRALQGGKLTKENARTIHEFSRIIQDPNADRGDKMRVVARVKQLEEQAAKAKGGGRTLSGATAGAAAKPELSAAEREIESQIKGMSEQAGKRAYARAIQGGASTGEADKAAKAEEKRVKADLTARAPDLIRTGRLGEGASAAFGTPLTAGGALPINLDVGGGKGGPPQVVVNNWNLQAQVGPFPDARFDASPEAFQDLAPQISRVVGRILTEGVREVTLAQPIR